MKYFVALWVMVAVGSCRQHDELSIVRVAAASDLTAAFEALKNDFEHDNKFRLTLSFGSTGLLARQLAEGAPFDVFASADTASIDALIAAGVCDGLTRHVYGRGRLSILGSTSIDNLSDKKFQRIAIANPEHAPYGRAAKAAILASGLAEPLGDRLVFAENVRQALQFFDSGNADAAIVARALVVDRRGDDLSALVPASLHPPIEQTIAVCRQGKSTSGGQRFVEYVNSSRAQALLRKFGYEPL